MTEPMKTAYFLGKFPQLTQTFVTREVFWIRRHGVQPSVFSFSRPRTLPQQDEVEEVLPLTRYGAVLDWNVCAALVFFVVRSPLRLVRAILNLFRNTAGEPALMARALAAMPRAVFFARQIRALGIRHIHVHFLTLSSVEACLAADLLDIPYSITVHAVGLFTRRRENIRRQMSRARRVVTISSFHRKRILELCPEIPPDHVRVVYCGLETERFRPVSRTVPSHAVPRILSIGRLIEKKGFEYLIDACGHLAAEGMAFECVIIGEGPLRSALAERASKLGAEQQVRLLGALGQPAVREHLADCDVFALPSVVGEDGNADGLPVVLVEAMSCGLPVVTTPVAGIVDLVEDGVTGRLVPQRDAAALAAALGELLRNDTMRESLGRAARARVVRDFRIEETTRRLAEVFRGTREGVRTEPKAGVT